MLRRRLLGMGFGVVALLVMMAVPALAGVGRTQVWANGELFDSVVTNTEFKPTAGNFDQL